MTEQASNLVFDVTVADGKYRIRQDGNYQTQVWRKGELWDTFVENGPDNLHLALATELHDLREQVAASKRLDDRAATLLHELRLNTELAEKLSQAIELPAGAQSHPIAQLRTVLVHMAKLVEPLKDIEYAELADPRGEYGTLVTYGVDPTGKEVIRSTRTSVDPARDQHLMSSFLELHDAWEKRGVLFEEHQLGALTVKPHVAAKE